MTSSSWDPPVTRPGYAGGAPAPASPPTLLVADEKGGYTLSDRGTYLVQRDNLVLEVLVEGDPALFNVYHVMQVNPAKSRRINAAAAAAFVQFITSGEGQKGIRGFGVDMYGRPL